MASGKRWERARDDLNQRVASLDEELRDEAVEACCRDAFARTPPKYRKLLENIREQYREVSRSLSPEISFQSLLESGRGLTGHNDWPTLMPGEDERPRPAASLPRAAKDLWAAAAVAFLAEVGEVGLLHAALDSLDCDTNDSDRHQANRLRLVVSQDVPWEEIVVDGVHEENEVVRAFAAKWLDRYVSSDRAVPLLRGLLGDAVESVRLVGSSGG